MSFHHEVPPISRMIHNFDDRYAYIMQVAFENVCLEMKLNEFVSVVDDNRVFREVMAMSTMEMQTGGGKSSDRNWKTVYIFSYTP